MLNFKDQCGREIQLKDFPLRIISTVPSQTELLCSLGLENNIVGITAYCVHPKNLLADKQVIGGTKDLQIEQILKLEPDLIIANKEENVKQQIEKLAETIPVWISDVETLEQGLDLISEIGELTSRKLEAEKLLSLIISEKELIEKAPLLKTLYFIWKDPFMAAGNSTYIGNVLNFNGLQNIAPTNVERYPQMAFDKLNDFDPELILLTSEPYSFNTKEAHELALKFPNALVKIVDGEMFTWYGSRVLLAMKYFQKLTTELRLKFPSRVEN